MFNRDGNAFALACVMSVFVGEGLFAAFQEDALDRETLLRITNDEPHHHPF
jgi:hypothetical protein